MLGLIERAPKVQRPFRPSRMHRLTAQSIPGALQTKPVSARPLTTSARSRWDGKQINPAYFVKERSLAGLCSSPVRGSWVSVSAAALKRRRLNLDQCFESDLMPSNSGESNRLLRQPQE